MADSDDRQKHSSGESEAFGSHDSAESVDPSSSVSAKISSMSQSQSLSQSPTLNLVLEATQTPGTTSSEASQRREGQDSQIQPALSSKEETEVAAAGEFTPDEPTLDEPTPDQEEEDEGETSPALMTEREPEVEGHGVKRPISPEEDANVAKKVRQEGESEVSDSRGEMSNGSLVVLADSEGETSKTDSTNMDTSVVVLEEKPKAKLVAPAANVSTEDSLTESANSVNLFTKLSTHPLTGGATQEGQDSSVASNGGGTPEVSAGGLPEEGAAKTLTPLSVSPIVSMLATSRQAKAKRVSSTPGRPMASKRTSARLQTESSEDDGQDDEKSSPRKSRRRRSPRPADQKEEKDANDFKKPSGTAPSAQSVSYLVLGIGQTLSRAKLDEVRDLVNQQFPEVSCQGFTVSEERGHDLYKRLTEASKQFYNSQSISPDLPSPTGYEPANLKASRLSEGSSTSTVSRTSSSGASGYHADKSSSGGSGISSGASSKRDRLSIVPEEPIKPHNVISPLPKRKPLAAKQKVEEPPNKRETTPEPSKEDNFDDIAVGQRVFALFKAGTRRFYYPADVVTDLGEEKWEVKFVEDGVQLNLPLHDLIPARKLQPGQALMVSLKGVQDDGVVHQGRLAAFPDLSQRQKMEFLVKFDKVEGIAQIDEKLIDFADVFLRNDQAEEAKKELGGRWQTGKSGRVSSSLAHSGYIISFKGWHRFGQRCIVG